jgi:hypothetical protein
MRWRKPEIQETLLRPAPPANLGGHRGVLVINNYLERRTERIPQRKRVNLYRSVNQEKCARPDAVIR